MNSLIKSIQLWARDKGLKTANPINQILKIYEEVAEASQAYVRNQKNELIMEIGDIFVTVIVFADQVGIDPEEALRLAYNKIKEREGQMIDGTFVKSEDIK